MKKVLLFAVALCLMISAQAQIGMKKSNENPLKSRIKTVEQLNKGTTAYTQKLDSMVMANGLASVVFEYDNHFNTKKLIVSTFGFTVVTEHTYDSQNHCTSSITTQSDGGKDKIEYTYNNQGLVHEATQYEFENGVWEEEDLSVFEYDANGNMVLVTTFDRENNDWVNDEKTEFTYQNNRLVSEMNYNWILDAWVEDQSVEYNYNAQGDLIEAIEFDLVDLVWLKESRTEYTYDANHNCISQTEYDYDSFFEDWEKEDVVVYTYDLSVSSNVIAGLDNFSDAIISLNNKLLTVEETDYDDGIPQETVLYTLYYSGTSGIGEHNDNSLVIWPNPAAESLNLNSDGLQQVEILTIDGRQVMRLENGFETINVSALAQGCYLLTATFADGSKAVQKFVKE
jgi:hypothetical protein